MTDRSTARPSDAELAVLKALWRHGEMSVREVHDAIAGDLGWAPNTTRTVIDRMRVKGLINRRDLHGVAVFTPAEPKVGAMARLIKDFARRVLDVDSPLPGSAFAASGLLNDAEVAELEALLQAESDADDKGDRR